jgi:hypothetical protein
MRLKTTKITFINLNIMDEFLLWRGNRSLNPRVFVAQFGHHRCVGKNQIGAALHNQIPEKTYLTL